MGRPRAGAFRQGPVTNLKRAGFTDPAPFHSQIKDKRDGLYRR